jgi:hypothetical protein
VSGLAAAIGAGVACASCNPGAGQGAIEGTLTVFDCGLDGPYSLAPDFFTAEGVLDGLSIRAQRGSDLVVYSDGLFVEVLDATFISRERLGLPLRVSTSTSRETARVSMYLNATCPFGRRERPVVLTGVSGTVTFEDVYVPTSDDATPRIVLRLEDVRLTDSGAPTTRFGIVHGWIDLVYNRGRPAQRYP